MFKEKVLYLIFLILSLSTLIVARQGSCVITSQSEQTCLANDPTIFTINDFTTFDPADGNPTPASITFRFSDDDNSVTAKCSSCNNKTANAECPATNDSPQISFTYDHNNLTISEEYSSCSNGTDEETAGFLEIVTNCYTNYPPSPQGYGTKCITLTGKLSGSFA